MEKSLLHLSNDFADQKIYVNLVRRLSEKDFKQIVYVPVKWKYKLNGNRDDSIKNTVYFYSYILRPTIVFKLRYFRKLRIILDDIESKIDLNEVSLIHAHFLFSDGGVAYKLKQKYDIPYVVSVRSSDLFVFFSKMPHLRRFGNEIMANAEQVIFINQSYKIFFERKYLLQSFSPILDKIKIIPNAIDDNWFNHPLSSKRLEMPYRILYVGRIKKRKKLHVLIQAINKLNKLSDKKFILEVVGQGEGSYWKKIKRLRNGNIFFHGRIENFEKLADVYKRCHVFAMPSVKETFGLVYIEALSQGLPIICCQNEGVDDYFENRTVGISVRPNSIEDIASAIKDIILEYPKYSSQAIVESKKFNWDKTTKNFIEVYNDIDR